MDQPVEHHRFPWWRLARWSVALVIVAAIVGHAMWGSLMEAGVNRRVQALRQAGEPILPADFAPVNPGGLDNAAPDIEAAAAMLDTKSATWEQFDRLSPDLPLHPKERDAILAVEKESAAALDRIEQARDKPRMELNLDLKSPVFFNIALPSMNNIRSLCSLEACIALVEHEQGNDASTLRRMDRILFIARYPQQHPSIVGYLVGVGCGAVTSSRVERLVSDLKIGTRDNEASPQQVRKMIDQLLDDRPFHDSYVRGLRGERMSQLDMMQSMAAGKAPASAAPGQTAAPSSALKLYALRPIFYRNARIMLDYDSAMIPLADAPDFPTARAKLPQRSQADRQSMLNVFANILTPSLGHVIEIHFRAMRDRRLAATLLALRWYAVEHEGKLPQSLGELVPRYLPAVPVDPLASGSKPIGYVPRANGPIVYSVGMDAVDDAGSEAASAERGNKPPRSEWEMRDRVMHLNRQPRSTDDESQ